MNQCALTFGHFRLKTFNIATSVAQYKKRLIHSLLQCVLTSWFYKLPLPVLNGQLELVMNIDLFIKN